jgi:hypothetical protein
MLAQALWTLALSILVIVAIIIAWMVVIQLADEFGDGGKMLAAWVLLAGTIGLLIWSIRFVIHRWLQYGCG